MDDAGSKGPQEKYLVVSVNGKYYAVQSSLVGEVTALDQVYPLPLLPPYFLGLINRYSVPYALIDLGFLIAGVPCGTKKAIVLKESVDRVALLIDDIIDIVDIDGSGARKVAQEGGGGDGGRASGGAGFEAVDASFEWRGNDILVLNVSSIIARIKADQER